MTAMHADFAQSPAAPAAARTPRPGVVERLTQILDVFASPRERLLLDDITAATGLPRSTAFRLLSQMVELDWLEHNMAGYQLGPRALRISTRGADHSDVRAAAADQLNTLQLRTGGVAHLSVLEGATMHYLDKVGGRALTSIPSAVGSRLPADTTASGHALLALLEPSSVDALFSHDHATRDMPRLHRKLGRVRRQQGIAFTPGERCQMEIGTVAAPVFGPHGAIAAISVAVRGTPRLDQLAPHVAHAAGRTSQMLFPHWKPPAARRAR